MNAANRLLTTIARFCLVYVRHSKCRTCRNKHTHRTNTHTHTHSNTHDIQHINTMRTKSIQIHQNQPLLWHPVTGTLCIQSHTHTHTHTLTHTRACNRTRVNWLGCSPSSVLAYFVCWRSLAVVSFRHTVVDVSHFRQLQSVSI